MVKSTTIELSMPEMTKFDECHGEMRTTCSPNQILGLVALKVGMVSQMVTRALNRIRDVEAMCTRKEADDAEGYSSNSKGVFYEHCATRSLPSSSHREDSASIADEWKTTAAMKKRWTHRIFHCTIDRLGTTAARM